LPAPERKDLSGATGAAGAAGAAAGHYAAGDVVDGRFEILQNSGQADFPRSIACAMTSRARSGHSSFSTTPRMRRCAARSARYGRSTIPTSLRSSGPAARRRPDPLERFHEPVRFRLATQPFGQLAGVDLGVVATAVVENHVGQFGLLG